MNESSASIQHHAKGIDPFEIENQVNNKWFAPLFKE
jgi:hypothetical protein